jgi:hypothetical protein
MNRAGPTIDKNIGQAIKDIAPALNKLTATLQEVPKQTEPAKAVWDCASNPHRLFLIPKPPFQFTLFPALNTPSSPDQGRTRMESSDQLLTFPLTRRYWPLHSMALAENKVLCAAYSGVYMLERLGYFLAGYGADRHPNYRAPGTRHKSFKRDQQRFRASWEAAYAEQVRERLEKQLRRRARELGFELKKIEPPAAPRLEAPMLEQVMMDGEVLTVKSDGEIVAVA